MAQSPNELSVRAKANILAARNEDALAISDKSLWELAMILRNDRNRIALHTSVLEFLQAVESRFNVLPVTSAVAAQAVAFSTNFPRDPADRIIAATAVVHRVPLMTRDKRIHASKEVDCVW